MSRSARTRARRRDRRKAKASNWRRQGKVKMGVVGHGPNGGSTTVRGPRVLSRDNLEALYRRHGVELSPAGVEEKGESDVLRAPLMSPERAAKQLIGRRVVKVELRPIEVGGENVALHFDGGSILEFAVDTEPGYQGPISAQKRVEQRFEALRSAVAAFFAEHGGLLDPSSLERALRAAIGNPRTGDG